MNGLDRALDQMRAAGMPAFPPGHPVIGAGKIIRYGPKKKAWYRLYEFRLRSGGYVVGGDFGMWGEIPSTRVDIDWKGISEEEREKHRAEREASELRERQARERRASAAASRAASQWTEALRQPPKGVETYLARKGVEHEKGLRYFQDGTLLVPMLRYDVTEAQEKDPNYKGPRRLVGLQKISPAGEKRFNAGAGKESAAFRLGDRPRAAEPIFITEGVATGLSLRAAIDRAHPVYVLFDAGNLAPAARILRKAFPSSPIIFCADDDAYLEASANRLLRDNYCVREILRPPLTGYRIAGEVLLEGKRVARELEVNLEILVDAAGVAGLVGSVSYDDRTIPIVRENAGRTYANKAAGEVGNAIVIFPQFADRKLPPDPDASKYTDFNDLQKLEGAQAVKQQLAAALDQVRISGEVQRQVKRELADRKEKAKKAKDAPPKPPKGGGEEFWRELFTRYTLVYPTETAWDAKIEELVKVSAMRLDIGEPVVKWWLRSKERRTVNARDVVFDPSEKCDPATTINLFRGLKMKPGDAGKCAKLLELVQYLCGERGQDQAPVTDWVLNWIAYPLQHLGAKMRSAVVMHGGEGTGKNLFWGAVASIYGPYGGLINQFQLQSNFNDWASRKMFIIANEVVTRMELRHLVGYLKNLVTEPRIPIETKNMPVREEDNRMQLVFLSNEFQPLHVAPGDRRYMVIKTPVGLPLEFYAEVDAEIKAGGAEALYAFLLARDLADFNEHTRPIQTSGKDNLIELGLSSPQQFWRDLHDGILGLPYVPCLAYDLYQAFQIYCARNGEKNPARLPQFSHQFMSMNGITRLQKLRLPHPDRPGDWSKPSHTWPQWTVFLMGERPEQLNEEQWLKQSVPTFRAAVREYARQAPLSRGAQREQDDVDDPAL